jgi:hypothetical protein
MIQYVVILMMLLPKLILVNTLGTNHTRQNVSEEINYLFSDLTPDNLGDKEPDSFDQINRYFNKNGELKYNNTDSIENNNSNNNNNSNSSM